MHRLAAPGLSTIARPSLYVDLTPQAAIAGVTEPKHALSGSAAGYAKHDFGVADCTIGFHWNKGVSGRLPWAHGANSASNVSNT